MDVLDQLVRLRDVGERNGFLDEHREVYDDRVLSPVDAAPSQSRSSAAEWGLPGQ